MKDKICPNCNEPLDKEFSFCTNCGAKCIDDLKKDENEASDYKNAAEVNNDSYQNDDIQFVSLKTPVKPSNISKSKNLVFLILGYIFYGISGINLLMSFGSSAILNNSHSSIFGFDTQSFIISSISSINSMLSAILFAVIGSTFLLINYIKDKK